MAAAEKSAHARGVAHSNASDAADAFERPAWLPEPLDLPLAALESRRGQSRQLRRRGWFVRRMLLLADVIGLVVAFAVAELAAERVAPSSSTSLRDLAVFTASLPGWVVVARLYGLYDHDAERTDHSTVQDLAPIFHMLMLCTAAYWFGGRVTGLAHPASGELIAFVATAVLSVGVARAAARGFSSRQVAYLQNTIIVGAGRVGQRVAQKLLSHPEYGINLVGFIDDQPRERSKDLCHLAHLGGIEQLLTVVETLDVERVVIAFSNDPHDRTLSLVRSLKNLDVQVDIVPRFFEILGPGVGVHTVEGLPLLGLRPLRLSRSSRLLKRLTDGALAAVAIICLSPLFVAIAVLIKLDSRGPVFFRQERMGSREQPFRIWKFRSMVVDAEKRKGELAHLNMHTSSGGDARMFKIPDDPRTTRVGRFLRRHSLDELPQLFNVVAGDMSLVGPRPLILAEDECVGGWGRRRLDLKPGITGVWQVLGRSGIPFSEMVNLDYLYVTGWSFWGDLELMMRTLPVFFRGAPGETSASIRASDRAPHRP